VLIFIVAVEIFVSSRLGIVAIVIKALVEVSPVLIFNVDVDTFVSSRLEIVAIVINALSEVRDEIFAFARVEYVDVRFGVVIERQFI